MKKIIRAGRLAAVFCAAGLLSAQAHARANWSAPLAKIPSIYSQLQSYFQEGAVAERSDLDGWRSGRCYSAAAPDTAYARLLLGGYAQPDADGPLFPSSRVPRFFFEAWTSSPNARTGDAPADRYDRLTPADAAAAQAEMKKLTTCYLGPVRGAVVDRRALRSDADGRSYAARVYDEQVGMATQGGVPAVRYVVVKIAGPATAAPLGSDVLCYFFSPDLEPAR
ncbi:MAG TPA: hypothetical protein VNK24_00835 [Elusimicrobiota bacterium]|nr:hypothetical protein [Elusimicrobiota bacterium]